MWHWFRSAVVPAQAARCRTTQRTGRRAQSTAVCPKGRGEQTAVMAGPAPVVAGAAVAAVVKVVMFVSVLALELKYDVAAVVAESNPSSASHGRT